MIFPRFPGPTIGPVPEELESSCVSVEARDRAVELARVSGSADEPDREKTAGSRRPTSNGGCPEFR